MSRRPPEPASAQKNEYIPSFIANKPFYLSDLSTPSDYLEHQRLQKAQQDDQKWYDRGKKLGPASTKFRKGACENCGAMTHKTKECLSRPRAKGARWTGRDIQADEVVQDVDLGWDAKRDRWNGYDAGEYRSVVREYEELEELKKRAKASETFPNPKLVPGDAAEVGDKEGDQEEARYAEESDMGRHQSTATRNLRIREDTAKYLLNLDLESAKYDPKTRSMVDMGAISDQAAALVAEDNFMRASGDAAEFESAQRFAWDTQERGDRNKVHIQANPTAAENARRIEIEERDTKKNAQRKLLLEKYGTQERHTISGNTLAVESEQYTEYDESGRIKEQPKTFPNSKYKEDVLVNNHTAVWGSWWKDFKWGYQCCHSTIRNSYCVGEDGRKAFEEAEALRLGIRDTDSDEGRKRTELGAEEERGNGVDGRERKGPDKEKKRTLQEMRGGVDVEELEAYKRARSSADDPMVKFLGRDELVH